MKSGNYSLGGLIACIALAAGPTSGARASAHARKEFRLLGAGCDSLVTLELAPSTFEGLRTRTFELPSGHMVGVRETSFGEGKLGYSLWTAGIGLATWLCADASRTRGKTVLELGSGIGLAGFACASIGGIVTLSDMDRVRADDWDSPTGLLESLRRSAQENGLSVRVRRIDWREHVDGNLAAQPVADGAATSPQSDDRFDVVIASDCVYYTDLLAPLVATLRRFLAPGGRAYVLSTDRTPASNEGNTLRAAEHVASPSHFAAFLRDAGWCTVQEQLCTCVTPYSVETMVLHEVRWRSDTAAGLT